MIKWLTEITVTAEESSNHFHYMDNRVLPEFVDAERATAEGWWYKPDYIINELNINSAIANPGEPTPGPATRRAPAPRTCAAHRTARHASIRQALGRLPPPTAAHRRPPLPTAPPHRLAAARKGSPPAAHQAILH